MASSHETNCRQMKHHAIGKKLDFLLYIYFQAQFSSGKNHHQTTTPINKKEEEEEAA